MRDYFVNLKDLPRAIQYLASQGISVKRLHTRVGGRPGYRVENPASIYTMADYDVLDFAEGVASEF